ncbi:putative D-tyrosyl-tRNA(Tyr) deacylase [groundwater metagenome]|uniref:Putative D-tyrosyl-tRNA(Tyr) deacylase n=1 Tax=groundwater metagenome TaxID=717931 RepID=A0A098EAQ0_9ZZZZ
MSKIILYSHQDIAGENISKFLNTENYKFSIFKNPKFLNTENLQDQSLKMLVAFLNNLNLIVKIFGIDEKVINLNDLPSEIYDVIGGKIDLIIVASRHKSESKMPTLCVHSPGNFNDARQGGNERTLAIAPALYTREAIIEFKKQQEQQQSLSEYDVTLEVTHHGPTLNFPIMFVEVGSSEEQWNDLNACEAAASVIKRLCNADINIGNENKVNVAIGIGGNHYASKFTKILLNEEIAFGHIMPKYNFNEEMIEQMISKTIPKPEIALIDWNGLNGEQRKKAVKRIEGENLEWRKV